MTLSFPSIKGKNLDSAQLHKDLIIRCKQGDRRAQYELYQRYARAMYNICLRMLGHAQDAEDVLQQSFMDAFHRLESFRFQSSFGAWLKRIVVNNCINFLKQRRLLTTSSDESWVELLAIPEHESSIEDEDESLNLDVQRVYEAMMQLPEGYRIVFNLYLFEGYDHREIAQILGISEATSKSQYHRAKRKLKKLLQAP